MCSTPWSLGVRRSLSFKQPHSTALSQAPAKRQSSARLRFWKSVFPERSLTEFRIARAIPYGTPKSLSNFCRVVFAAQILSELRGAK